MMIKVNYRMCIFENMGVVATKPRPLYDIVPRAPLVKIFRNHHCTQAQTKTQTGIAPHHAIPHHTHTKTRTHTQRVQNGGTMIEWVLTFPDKLTWGMYPSLVARISKDQLHSCLKSSTGVTLIREMRQC